MKPLTVTLLFILNLFLLPQTLNAVVSSTPVSKFENSVLGLNSEDIIKYDHQESELRIGKKLKFKEKIALRFLKRKLKKETGKKFAPANKKTKTEKLALAGLVLGLLGVWLIPLIASILAIILSSIALKRIKQDPASEHVRGRARTGLILGIVGVFLFGVAILFLAFLFDISFKLF